ncbi:MAG: hypothetical protein ACO1SX_14560 [Actinomycetota bacterium]
MTTSPWRITFLILAFCLALAEVACGGGYFMQKVHRTEYESPSGRFRLEVDPTHPYGAGPGRYRLKENGAEIWAGERPFTLSEAAVANDGTVAGFGYTKGLSEFSKGHLVVALIDPKGKVRLDERTPQTPSRYLHMPANPVGNGVILDPAGDRVVIRIGDPDVNRGSESWRIYRLSTARKWKELAPRELMPNHKAVRYVLDARPVPGTPLILVHWWRYESFKTRGAAFTLIDPDGRTVWRLELPEDYEIPGDPDGTDSLMEEVRSQRDFLSTAGERRFSLRFVRAGQQVSYQITSGAGATWSVAEVGRKPYSAKKIHQQSASRIAPVSLEPLGSILLRNPVKPLSEVRNIQVFAVADHGNLCIIRQGPADLASFVLVQPSGQARALPIPGFSVQPSATWSGCVSVGKNRFVAVYSAAMSGSRASGWLADFTRGSVTALAEPLPATHAIAALPSGGFAALNWRRYNSSLDLVNAYDDVGNRLWKIEGDRRSDSFFDGESLIVTRDGLLGIYDPQGKSVALYGASGKFVRQVSLQGSKESWLFSELAALPDGGFLKGSMESISRFDATGKLVGSYPLRFPGNWKRNVFGIHVSSGGKWWTSDGNSLLQLDSSGKVSRTLGDDADPNLLSAPVSLTIGSNQKYYVVDGRTHAVHAFNPDGTPAEVYRATAGTKMSVFGPRVMVDPDGAVFLGALDGENLLSGDSRYLRFTKSGKQTGPVTYPGVTGETWLHAPNSQHLWVVSNDTVTLLNGKRRTVRKHARSPSGEWLEFIHDAAVGPDGSLAVLEGGVSFKPNAEGSARISLFSPSGAPLRVVTVPLSTGSVLNLALGKARIVAISDGVGYLMRLDGSRLQQFKLPRTPGCSVPASQPFLTASDSELLLYDGDRMVRRFKIPNAPTH